jgi:nitrogen fixation/metabolism regulation signal transduction histidine kinase
MLASLERHRQWRVLMPLMIQEQRVVIVGFSVALFAALLGFAIWTLRRLTRPLRNLAVAVERIGKGESLTVAHVSGGALGTVEQAVAALQQELGVLREQARVQGMEAAWKDIARVMAHEIKNPLTPIRLTLDRMEEKAALGESLDADKMKTFLERINTQVDLLERLVNQFRSFSREPEAHLKPVDTGEAIRAVAETMMPKLNSTIQGNATIMADPHLLGQVLLNIWKNSLEAGADRMSITIAQQGGSVTITIRDNGSGIPAAELQRVWLPYVTTKQTGTGLGLPVVKRMVETMRGSVGIRSQIDGVERGVTMVLVFPRGDSAAVSEGGGADTDVTR